TCPVSFYHQYADAERLAPAERIEADHSGRVQDHETAEAMSGTVVAADPSMLADPVVDFECATLDGDSNSEAVTNADSREIRPGICLFDRRNGVGDVLGRKHERRRGRGSADSYVAGILRWSGTHSSLRTGEEKVRSRSSVNSCGEALRRR